MGTAAFGARQGGPDNCAGGSQHRAQFERVLQIEIELTGGTDAKTRPILLAHLVNARERGPEFLSGSERAGLLPHELLQLGLDSDRGDFVRSGISPEGLQL